MMVSGVRALHASLLPLLLFGHLAGARSSAGSEAPPQADVSPATAVPDRGPVAGWQLFTSPDRSFSVRLPGEPKASRDATQTTYLVRIGRDVTYFVVAFEPGIFFGEVRPIKELLETARDLAREPLREYGGRLLWSEIGRTSLQPCITFLEEATPKGFPLTRVLSRIILDVDDVRMFSIIHSAPAEEFQEQKAKEFIASFVLVQDEKR
jgi:hypothetical protein